MELTAIIFLYVAQKFQQQAHPLSYLGWSISGLLDDQAYIPVHCTRLCSQWL